MKSILITGCSSGFGLETARYFLERGWRVVATMREQRDVGLPASPHLHILELEVTDDASIRAAVEAAGPIDVLVNNAGIGILNALEGTSLEQVRQVFATNTIGTIAMTRAVLPQLRARRSGVIVNVTSSVTLVPLTLLSVYTASKAAVNAFSESLALELEPFDVRVRLVLPGRAPSTRFGATALGHTPDGVHPAYEELARKVFANWAQDSTVTQPGDVAAAVWKAVHDGGAPARIHAGADVVALAASLYGSA